MFMTAQSSDVNIAPPSRIVTFMDGENSTQIFVTAIEDSFPELREELQLELISVTGKLCVCVCACVCACASCSHIYIHKQINLSHSTVIALNAH